MCSELDLDPPAAGTAVTFRLTQQLSADPGGTTSGTTSDPPSPDDSPADGGLPSDTSAS